MQAVSGLESLKMANSPAKKLDFDSVGKENVPLPQEPVTTNDMDLKKPLLEPIMEEKPAVAPTIEDIEANEPILQENPHRFVLFPIKYHEVCNAYHLTRGDVFASA